MSFIHLKAQVPVLLDGYRLDWVLAQLFPEYSRRCHQTWIRDKQVTVDAKFMRSRDTVQSHQVIEIHGSLRIESIPQPESIPLNIVYEDASLLVIDKPPGLLAHPGAGHPDRTLLNALLHFDSHLKELPRGGLVHRLDKDTSGLIMVARRLSSYLALVQLMKKREIKREYDALIQGVLMTGGTIDRPIGRDPRQRTKMAVVSGGKAAVTHYRVTERMRGHTWLRVFLETGRTHQIRVHLNSIGHPIVGDKAYLRHIQLPKDMSEKARIAVRCFLRQALHARKLTLRHPEHHRLLTFESPLPSDIKTILATLRADRDRKSISDA